jgi:hypothetical protein
MTDSSRLRATAAALREALDTLADALAQPRADAIAASEARIEARAGAFRAAALAALDGGAALASDEALGLQIALRRCRRLGASLSLLARVCTPPPLDSPAGYTAVGQPLSHGDEVPFLTARG